MTRGLELLDVTEVGGDGDRPAGPFGDWLAALRRSDTAGSGMDVPCGPCNACCRSGFFIHVGAAERETLARIPAVLLVPAPGRPGDRIMGFDRRGHCPMLVDDACTIYDRRPLACRQFDCRVFTAAGIDPADAGDERDEGKADLAAQAAGWHFTYPAPDDRRRHAAIATAARLLDEFRGRLGDAAPANRTGQALRAIECHEALLTLDDRRNRSGAATSDAEILSALRSRRRTGPAGGPDGG